MNSNYFWILTMKIPTSHCQPLNKNNPITLKVNKILGKRRNLFKIESGDPYHCDYFWLSRIGLDDHETRYTLTELQEKIKLTFGKPKALVIQILLEF